ncbi:MAG: biotin transporter BioY [Synergistaceae bacterium]|nr:biotin transporter BioY [Synergistota bacterium]NLM70513.1 biotin transporter BioY [Synergistaceae bacterium]
MKVKEWLLACLFAVLTIVGAFVRIPLPVVPLTLQVLIVLLSGFVLGPRYGMLSQVVYLMLGLCGMPVFSGGGGIGYVLSPTFGYLLSYPVAAYVVGVMSPGENAAFSRFAIASFTGLTVIYILGATILYLNLRFIADKGADLVQVLQVGVLPFVAPDLLKAIGAAFIARKTSTVIRLN